MTRMAPSIETLNLRSDLGALVKKSASEGKRCYQGVIDCFSRHANINPNDHGIIRSQLLFCCIATALPFRNDNISEMIKEFETNESESKYHNIFLTVLRERHSISDYEFFLNPDKNNYYNLLGVDISYIKQCYYLALQNFGAIIATGSQNQKIINQLVNIQINNYLCSLPEHLHEIFIAENHDRIFRQIASNVELTNESILEGTC